MIWKFVCPGGQDEPATGSLTDEKDRNTNGTSSNPARICSAALCRSSVSHHQMLAFGRGCSVSSATYNDAKPMLIDASLVRLTTGFGKAPAHSSSTVLR